MLKIRVRRLGAKDGKVCVASTCSVPGLKDLISSITGVAADQQRLIFHGQVLSVCLLALIVFVILFTLFCY